MTTPIRSSLWTTPRSVTIPTIASVTSLELVIVGFGALFANVATSIGTGGIRLYYAQKPFDGSDPNFLSFVDVQATPGVVQPIEIPLIPRQGQTTYVDAVPALGWDAANGMVTGAFGQRVRAIYAALNPGNPVMPVAKVTTVETTAQGTLNLDISDPQGRVTLVEVESQSGNGPWSGWDSPVETISPYHAYVALVPKQPSKIAYRVWGPDATGVISILAQDLITFSVGGTPLAPVLREFVDTAGNIQVSWQGDSDTNNVKIAASLSDYPTAAIVRATAALPGASGLSGVLVTAQVGALLYVSAFAYNADGGEGPMAQFKVHYLGIGTTPLPDIVMGTPIRESTRVRFPFSWDSQTTDIDAWYEVFASGSQPASARSSIRATGATALPSISVSETITELAVPLSGATDYAMLTLVGRDPLNQKGTPQYKLAQGASPTLPAAPTAASNTVLTSDTVTNSVTTPSAALTTWKIRTRIGSTVFADTPVAVAGAHAQSISYATHAGEVRTYTYTMLDPSGIESATSQSVGPLTSPPPSAPSAPSVALGYDTSTQIIDAGVTPAGGTPNNITWHLEWATTSGGTYSEVASAATLSFIGTNSIHLQWPFAEPVSAVTRWIRVWGTVAGVTGTRSTAQQIAIPARPAGGGGGGGGQQAQ